MATRIYFPNGVYGPDAFASFPFDAAWEGDTSWRYKCSPSKANTAFALLDSFKYTADQPFDVPIVQYVSDPLGAQTISGTVKGQFRVYQDASAQFCRAIVIRVVSGDGLTVRGTLLSHFPATLTSEWNTFLENRSIPPADAALTEVEAQEGDRLVIEIGFRSFSTDGGQIYYGYLGVGDPSVGTDLPENETETGSKRGWLEFSQSLIWSLEPSEFAGAGILYFNGSGVVSFVPPAAFAANGYLEIAGTAAMEATTPDILELAADGYLQTIGGGRVSFLPPPVSDFLAAGHIVFKGAGQMDLVLPGAPTITELTAAGFIALMAQVQASFDDALVLELAAAGYLSLGSYLGASVGFVAPTSLPVKNFVAAGCLELGGPGGLDFPELATEAYAAHTGLGGAALLLMSGEITVGFIRPLISKMGAEGEIVIEAPEFVEDGTFDTYVLTGFRNEPSIYSNFRFNSYAKHQGKYYGAKEDGVYLLEGDDDAGEGIHPGVRIGPANFSTDRQKRVHLLRLGGECEQARVKVSNGNGNAGYFDSEQGRVSVSRDIQGREITIEISDFETLNHLEIVPKVLARR